MQAAHPALLEVRNLETWYGPVAAMSGINIVVNSARIVAVLGANGAGKSTLLNTVAGVIDPFKGQVLFNQQEIQGLDADAVSRLGLKLVPEGRQVFPFLSVVDNLSMGAYAYLPMVSSPQRTRTSACGPVVRR